MKKTKAYTGALIPQHGEWELFKTFILKRNFRAELQGFHHNRELGEEILIWLDLTAFFYHSQPSYY